MAAKTASANAESLTETDEKAIEIIETVGEGDRVLFNDRVQPLTVKDARGPYEGRNDYDWVELEGPRGGSYKLGHWKNKRHGDSVSLRRHTGYNDDGFPTYDEMQLSSIELVDHHEFHIGQVFEVAEPIVGDEYYHVVTSIPDSGCYDAETVGIWVEDGEVKRTKESGFFNSHAKEQIFNGDFQLVDGLDINRDVHYDTERDEEIRLSDPHKRGVDLRPTEDSGLEVVKWETILFGFEERFTSSEETEEGGREGARVMTDGGTVECMSESEEDETIVSLEVTYTDSEPSEIKYFHTVFGMMKFDIEGEVATLSPKWDRLGDRDLKDGFDRWITTGDVLRSVQRLPFIESVEVSEEGS